MSIGTSINSLRLLLKNLNTNESTKPVVKKIDIDKPDIFHYEKESIHSLERDFPENNGIRREFIDSYINELNSDLSIKVNRLLIIKNNKVIAERYEAPYQKDSWDCVFSASKSLVALALGLLYDEGKVNLDLPVCKYLGNEKKITLVRNKKITLRHLLTHSTGSNFNEMSTPSSYKWVKDFFNSGYKFKLGTKFDYNSLNTYIISAVVEKIAGVKFQELVEERIFKPLDINKTYLDVSPEGYFKGGWGLYILPEDMAKLGIMVRDFGKYNGKRIISREWITMMTHKQFEASSFNHVFDYGFQTWVDEKNNFCTLNGMFDQNILVYRNSGIVVVTCCSNNEAFHGSNLFKISHKYFAKKDVDNFPLCLDRGSHEVSNYNNLLYYYYHIVDKEYKPVNKIANTCGVMPLLLQNELGVYVQGIKSIKFLKDGKDYSIELVEGKDTHKIKFDFKDGVRQTLTFYRNVFDCAAQGRFILSGKGEVYFVISISFLEYPSTRYITIKFSKDEDVLSFEYSENPGFEFVRSLIDVQTENVKKFIQNAMNIINPDLITGKIRNIFAPTFIAICGDKKIRTYNQIKKKKS